MSVTCGFFNSLNGDRKYDSVQISQLFDGLIVDGVFASIGTCFVAEADTGLNVNIGIGKAWFNNTWTLNDAVLPMQAPISEVLLDRIDAVVIEVDTSEAVRNNDIKFVQGVPSSSPIRPTLASGATLNQYPICYIHRPAGSTEITQSQITNMIGSEATPFVTGILQTISLDVLLDQWEDALDQFIANEQADFTDWFEQIKGQLDEDAAGNLQNQINEMVPQFTTGWIPANETWEYDSAASFRVSGNVVSKYPKGTPVKWTQNGTVRESNVRGVSYSSGYSIITMHPGYFKTKGDCSVLDTAAYPITNNQYSRTPVPKWFSFPVTVSASAGAISGYTVNAAKYLFLGELIQFYFDISVTNNGTGSGSLQIELPFGLTNCVIYGRESGVTGKALMGVCQVNIISVYDYQNGYPLANNARPFLKGSAEY